MNNKKHIQIFSTSYILCISYYFVENINIYFFRNILHKAFDLTLLLYETCSIFNDNKLGACAILILFKNFLYNMV